MEHTQIPDRAAAERQVLDRLLRLEALTTELLTCPEAQLAERLDARQALIDEIRALRPDSAVDASPEDELVRELTDQCRAVVCRLQQLDRQAVARLETMQQQILEKIRSTGKSAGARAARFYTPSPSSPTFSGSI